MGCKLYDQYGRHGDCALCEYDCVRSMTDEYGNEGCHRYSVTLVRGDEEKQIEVCANSEADAENVAIGVAEDETHIIWNDEKGDIEVVGTIDIVED